MDKRSTLLIKFVNYGEKKFYNIGPWIPVVAIKAEKVKKIQ